MEAAADGEQDTRLIAPYARRGAGARATSERVAERRSCDQGALRRAVQWRDTRERIRAHQLLLVTSSLLSSSSPDVSIDRFGSPRSLS